MTAIQAALNQTLLWLTSIPSPIGQEQALCEAVLERLSRTLPSAKIERHEHSLVVKCNQRAGLPKISLAGHLDTVLTEHDGPPRIEGDRLFGPGSADMKSGLAVMIELVERLDLSTLPCELTLVFYEKEEGPFDENMLGPLLEHFSELREQNLAICLEPSDNTLQLGCMGSVHVTIGVSGTTAHSARPWQGDNAIIKAAPLITELGTQAPNDVHVDGLLFREVMTPTMASAGRSRNIVPDLFEFNLNYRFAPGRSLEQALQHIQTLVGDRANVHAVDLSPAGRPHATNPLVQQLAACAGDKQVAPKQAWTDVARFDQLDVPAVNFGPGNQAQAHQRNESTDLPQLATGYAILERFLTTLK